MPTPTATAPPADIVGPLERGVSVLRALAAFTDAGAAPGGRKSTPTAQLARATGLARSTVDRVLATLAECGLVRLAGHDVEPAPGLAAIGNAYLSSCRLPDVLTPIVSRLAEEFDESVSVAVPDADGVRFVTQLTRRRTMSPVFRTGDLLPAERCAPGMLFAGGWDERAWASWRARLDTDPAYQAFPALHSPAVHPPGPPVAPPGGWATGPPAPTAPEGFPARSAQASARGYAVDDQLVETGLIAVAVPVRDTTGAYGPPGRILAGLSVVSHTSRHSAASLAGAALDELRAAAAEAQVALAADAAGPHHPAAVGVAPASAAATAQGAKAELGSGYLQSLARGLAVVTAFGAERRSPTLSELATATGLPRATVRRSLLTLEHLGYVRADGRAFRLLPRILELGYAPLTRCSLGDLAQPHLIRLVEQVHESASVTVLSGDDIHYVARVPTTRIMSVAITVGTRFPAYATSMGRVLLAGLPPAEREAHLARVRPEPLTQRTVTDPRRLREILDTTARAGYALVCEELEEGLQSVAVPVRDRAGRTVAAANVSMHAGRVRPEDARERLLPPLRAAAAAIEADLHAVTAYRPTPTQ